MKTFLLALGFCLICASSQVDPEEINGSWRTIYLAADDVEKIFENSELRFLFRHLECTERCKELSFTFYVKSDGECQKLTGIVEKNATGFYEAEYSGKNFFKIMYLSNGVLAFYNENVDKQGQVTRETLAAAKEDDISEEELQKFEELTVQMNIPKEYIRRVIETDDCPAEIGPSLMSGCLRF